ncbi:SCP2 sterol-binding domain-containing protein [Kushneria konosiri]|uniref:SCP-2 family sterol carrier protein n=1 Tax=Kushneria konosiri TaxID=698828 RepID=A0A2Z2H932_9GAMM|nr:SCP2 sterol-binding domain-containing protein [Kushneria konosiri]ARS53935.1 SCP-2 family sterol carrier protein [Kushneria konosiri]
MVDTAPLIAKLHERFDAEAAAGVQETLQLELNEGPRYFVVIDDGTLNVQEGVHDAPSVTLMTDTRTFERLINKELGGMQAVMSGKVRARGDIMLASRLTRLFRRSQDT